MTDLTPPKLVLDDYQQLIVDALLHTYTASEGQFAEFSPTDIVPAFISALAFAGSELLYKANLSSESAAKSFISSVVGVTRSEGRKSVTTIQFGLSTTLTSNFLIPAGFEVSTSGEDPKRFYTLEDLVILAGQNVGLVRAEAEAIGDEYNIGAGFLDSVSSPLTYLQYAINIEAATGGQDPEEIDNYIERVARILRLRNPVSGVSFEEIAQVVMGEGSRARCIGKLGQDKNVSNPQLGVVHLFLQDRYGKPATLETQNLVGNAVSPRLLLGVILYISPLEQYEVSIDLIIKSTGEKPANLLAEELYLAIKKYLSPSTFPIGQAVLIDEVKYYLREVGGFYIGSLHLNDLATNIPIPNSWTIAKLGYFSVQILDPSGANVYTNTFFEASGDE